MSAALGFGVFMAWLGIGGWAFRKVGHDADKDGLNALFVCCLLLAPFMAGFAIADQKSKVEIEGKP